MALVHAGARFVNLDQLSTMTRLAFVTSRLCPESENGERP
jgi:hypothetical protein